MANGTTPITNHENEKARLQLACPKTSAERLVAYLAD
jgi:hypothetical protein